MRLQATMLLPGPGAPQKALAAMLFPGACHKALMPSQMHLPRQMLLHGAPQKTLMSQMHLHRQAMLLLGAPQKALMSSQVDLASAKCDALVRWRRVVGPAAHAAAAMVHRKGAKDLWAAWGAEMNADRNSNDTEREIEREREREGEGKQRRQMNRLIANEFKCCKRNCNGRTRIAMTMVAMMRSDVGHEDDDDDDDDGDGTTMATTRTMITATLLDCVAALHYYTTTQLHNSTTTLLQHYTTTRLRYYDTALRHYDTTTLPHYYATTRLHCYTTTLLPY